MGAMRIDGRNEMEGSPRELFLRGFVPVSKAGAGHALAEAAFFQEILLEAAELPGRSGSWPGG